MNKLKETVFEIDPTLSFYRDHYRNIKKIYSWLTESKLTKPKSTDPISNSEVSSTERNEYALQSLEKFFGDNTQGTNKTIPQRIKMLAYQIKHSVV